MLKLKLKEKSYKQFIDFACETCDSISLIFEKSEAGNSLYTFQEEYNLVLETLIKKEPICVHPDTGSCFENADIIYLKINNSISSFLKQADSIFDWNGRMLPEELCIYRDNMIWLTCISHERLLHIHNEASDDIEFLKNNKIKFTYEI